MLASDDGRAQPALADLRVEGARGDLAAGEEAARGLGKGVVGLEWGHVLAPSGGGGTNGAALPRWARTSVTISSR